VEGGRVEDRRELVPAMIEHDGEQLLGGLCLQLHHFQAGRNATSHFIIEEMRS
jgi:hypothetical protein